MGVGVCCRGTKNIRAENNRNSYLSEMDDEDCERRRLECLHEMSDLEKQFLELKDKLFRERLSQVKMKLDEVIAGRAAEYKEPLAVLHKNMQLRTEVAGTVAMPLLMHSHINHDNNIKDAGQGRRDDDSERSLLLDTMKTELLDKIHRLEEDWQSRDISSEWWSDEGRGKKYKKRSHSMRPERRKKAALVSGPYIVYMLRDIDILEDWTAIKKVLMYSPPTLRCVCALSSSASLLWFLPDRQQYCARCQGGVLYYEGERFCKGNTILLNIKEDATSQAVITAVSTGEVWLRRTDGSKTKIYVSQLQKGKYTISKV
uniref:BRMS1 transcriptional repressor and anoikis regulator n=1 Tax=Scleropages formosus TaxID=113540 RepID=A0A8C9SNG0_SCLFO